LRCPDSLSMKHNTWKLLESAVLETLEGRQMMSAAPLPGISLANGNLSMIGDATKPTSMVVDYTNGSTTELYARYGNVVRWFPVSQVKSINIQVGDGDNYVYVVPQLKVDTVITAGNGNDSIHAGGGNASITAGTGNDVIYASQGNNVIHLGDGNNVVLGAGGNDEIVVGNGNNYVYGGAGDDSITAGSGDNTLIGAAGNDTIVAGDGNNSINGGMGNDNITAGNGQDSIFGSTGNDSLSGGGANSVVKGGIGTNVILGLPTQSKSGSGTTVGSANPGGSGGSTNSGGGAGSGTTTPTSGAGNTGTGATGASGTGTTGTGTGGTTTGGTGTTGTGTGGSNSGGTTSGGTGTGTTGTGTTGTGTSGTGSTVQPPATNPNAPAPIPMLNLLDGVRQVGIGVNVDGLSSKLAAGTPLTADYQWDFGDPKTQFNTMTGFNASHVYDTPGTYTIKLTVTNQDGGVASATQQVTIAASTRTQFYVDSVHGSDNNAGTENAPFQSFAKAVTMIGNNTEILFHAGEKFDVLTGVEINAENVVIGSYGSGANPVLNRIKGVGSRSFATWTTANGVTFQNLTFDSPYGVGPNDLAPKTGVSGLDLGGQNMVVRNCTFLNIDDAINENGNPTGVLIENNSAPLATGLRGYFVWGQGAQSVIVGNYVANSTREHDIRMVTMNEVTVEDNNLANLNRQNVDPSDFSKGGIEMHVGSYAYIADNTLTDGDIRVGPLGLWGESPSDSTDWSVIEDNQLTGTDIYVNSGAHHVMIQGNVITNNSSEGIDISGPDGEGRTSEDVTITHNTGIDTGSTGAFLYVAGYVDGVSLTNNLYVAPNVGSTPAVNVSYGNLSVFTTIANNIWPAESENATSAGSETPAQWNANSQVQTDTFETVALKDTYDTTLGSLLVGSPLARAA
jgi:hypothetical protein